MARDAEMARTTVAAIVMCAALAAVARAAITPDEASTQAWQVAGRVMSPFCPGRTLAACPSAAAAQLRAEIAGRLAAGETPDQIVENLIQRYGEHIRGEPRPQGAALALWIVPAAFGGLLLTILIASAKTGGLRSAAEANDRPVSDEGALRARLDEELDLLG